MPWIQIRHNITFYGISGQTTLNSLLVHTLGNSGVHLGGSSARAWSTQPENGNKRFKANWSILICWKIMNKLSCAFLHAIESYFCTTSARPVSLTPTNVKVFVSSQSASQGCANLHNYQRMLMAGVLFDQILENQVLTNLQESLVKNDARKFSRLQSTFIHCIMHWVVIILHEGLASECIWSHETSSHIFAFHLPFWWDASSPRAGDRNYAVKPF